MRILIEIILSIILVLGFSDVDPGTSISVDTSSNIVSEFGANVLESSIKLQELRLDTLSTHHIRFERETNDSSTDDIIMGGIAAVTVDDQNRVFIFDQDLITIHVFDPEGNYLTSIGRQGQGPGEFGSVTRHSDMTIHSNQLFVVDTIGNSHNPGRMQVFSLEDLSFSRTVSLMAENRDEYEELEIYAPEKVYPRNDSMFLVAYHQIPFGTHGIEGFIRYVIQDTNGNIITSPIIERDDQDELSDIVTINHEEINIPVTYRASHSFHFFRKSIFAVSEDDQIYTAWTGEFKIDVYTPNGEYIRSFQYPYQNRTLELEELIDHYERIDYMSQLGSGVAVKLLREADSDKIPETWPALESMFFDDENRIWMSTIVENQSVYQWWILTKSGDVITKFEWPRNEPIEIVRNGFLYTRETDQDTGLQTIVRYRIEMEEI